MMRDQQYILPLIWTPNAEQKCFLLLHVHDAKAVQRLSDLTSKLTNFDTCLAALNFITDKMSTDQVRLAPITQINSSTSVILPIPSPSITFPSWRQDTIEPGTDKCSQTICHHALEDSSIHIEIRHPAQEGTLYIKETFEKKSTGNIDDIDDIDVHQYVIEQTIPTRESLSHTFSSREVLTKKNNSIIECITTKDLGELSNTLADMMAQLLDETPPKIEYLKDGKPHKPTQQELAFFSLACSNRIAFSTAWMMPMSILVENSQHLVDMQKSR